METAQALQPYTSEVHLFARARVLPQGGYGVRFAYETHYVGDIRAGRTTILDTYLLKSLDSFDFNTFDNGNRLLVIPCLGGRRCMWHVADDDCNDDDCKKKHWKGGQGLNYRLPVVDFVQGGALAQQIRKLLQEHAPGGDTGKFPTWIIEPNNMKESLDDEEDKAVVEKKLSMRKEAGIDETVFDGVFEELNVDARLLQATPKLMDALAEIRAKYGHSESRYPMDHIIRCFGWVIDKSVFDKDTIPLNTTHKGKYPQIHHNFSAVGVPGLYFAGTLAHGLDFRHSAGGFIHGFRYTARSLFRFLEEKNEGKTWPQTKLDLQKKGKKLYKDVSTVNIISDMMLRRINEASGPYQMFEFLGDMLVFSQNKDKSWKAQYLDEVPLKEFHERYKDSPRVTWSFRYGNGFYGSSQVLGPSRVGSTSMFTADQSKFLHPHIQFFQAGSMNSSRAMWITEDIFTSWTSLHAYSPLVRWVCKVLETVTEDPDWLNSGSEDYSNATGSRPLPRVDQVIRNGLRSEELFLSQVKSSISKSEGLHDEL
jgi:hypothetical protein